MARGDVPSLDWRLRVSVSARRMMAYSIVFIAIFEMLPTMYGQSTLFVCSSGACFFLYQ